MPDNMMRYFIRFFLFLNLCYCNAQIANDSIVTEGRDFSITKSNAKALINFDSKMPVKADDQIILYNKYQFELPLIEIKWWMQLDRNLTILYKNDQLISIDAGRKSDPENAKLPKWKLKKYKRNKKHIVEEDPIDLLEEGLVRSFKSYEELLFENNIYIESLDKKIQVNEVYHYSNGVVDILVVNKGELNDFIKKNIESFRFVK